MKKIRFFIIGIFSIYVMLLLLDIFVSKLYLKSNLFEGELSVWNDIKNKNIDKDLVLYGSSRTYVHINPEILDKKLNIDSYNLGFNGQTMSLIKFRNDVVLENQVYPKNVVINLDIVALTKGGIFNEEQLIPMLLFDKKIYKLVNQSLDLNILDLYIPLVRYRKFRYKNLDMKKELYKVYFYSNYDNNYRKKGFRGINYPWTESNKGKYEIKIDSSYLEDLENMIKDLKSIKANVILINSPEYITQINNQINRKEVLDLYKSISKKYAIPFIDYTKDSINLRKELFYNPNHLNSKGADVFTNKLAKDLKPYLKK